jgi:hypothetical protein
MTRSIPCSTLIAGLINGFVKLRRSSNVANKKKQSDPMMERYKAIYPNKSDAELAQLLADARAKGEQNGKQEVERRLVIRKASDVVPVAVEWLWKGWVALGKWVAAIGASTCGKSPVLVDIAARTTTGSEWPDKQENKLGARDVLIMATEDDFDDTILPRFLAAGGDRDRLHFVEGSCPENVDNDWIDAVSLGRDFAALRATIEQLPDLALVIIDPISDYLGRARINDTGEVRALFTPIIKLAQQKKFAVVAIGHINRREDAPVQQRSLGAEAFYGKARSAIVFGKGPDQEKYEHTMIEDRNKTVPALMYRTVAKDQTFKINDQKITCTDVITVQWLGKDEDITPEELLNPQSSTERTNAAKLLAPTVLGLMDTGARTVNWLQETLQEKNKELKITDDLMNRIRRELKGKIGSYQKDRVHWWRKVGESEEVAKPKKRKF